MPPELWIPRAWLTRLQHDALFVQLFGWYESDNYVHIAMEYINHGDLRNYLEVERSESEAKAITRQLLEGLVVIHQEGFAHRDLKPEVRPPLSSRCKRPTYKGHRTSLWSPRLPSGSKSGTLGLRNLRGVARLSVRRRFQSAIPLLRWGSKSAVILRSIRMLWTSGRLGASLTKF